MIEGDDKGAPKVHAGVYFLRGVAWAAGLAAFSGGVLLIGKAISHRAERRAARYAEHDDPELEAEFARRELRRRELAGED